MRGPVCTFNSKIKTSITESWVKEKLEITYCNDKRPSLQVFFTNDGMDKYNGCHCSPYLSNTYSLSIENEVAQGISSEILLVSLFFPKTAGIQIATYTFTNQSFNDGLFCQELRFNCGHDIRLVKILKDKVKPFFEIDQLTNTCLIIFCNVYSLTELMLFVKVLQEWFPINKVRGIWGAIVESISVCQVVYNKNFCRVNTEFSIILINSPFMEIVFYKTSGLDIQVFRDIFPEVYLFPIFGRAVIHGNSFDDFLDNFLAHCVYDGLFNTSIMIITYD
ncbi:hypothetical protein M0802_005918 [Mischocyttarus mexicanus]|nr:hypothetical protein M0802_005918 [Mischocyttarus mexicanus]